MRRNKEKTRELILQSAKKEFLRCNYERASVRTIAEGAGITAGALYKHFKTKEDIFLAIVMPVYQDMMRKMETVSAEAWTCISKDSIEDFEKASDVANDKMLNYLYEYFDEIQLMFNHSRGTAFENIRHDIVVREVEGGMMLIEMLKKKGYNVEECPERRMHLLASTALEPLFEIITHSYSYEETVEYKDIIKEALNFGWKFILKTENI